ncbi:MAG: GFA family protein [Betaproteobacteria bacterium]|nr:MAG: GFA family protein [Betaproteobacteria bacterium]TMH68792.1 MAG: GFA family protein [Betaproteobacteria bacterium]
MNSDVVEGGCLCGAIRYRIMGTALSRGICHCRTCRRASGAPSVAWVTFRSSDVSFLAGEPTIFRSSPPVLRTFCGRCGTPLTYRHASDPDAIDVTTVSLDIPERFAPEREIWTEDKLPWEALNDALPHYRRTRSEGTA